MSTLYSLCVYLWVCKLNSFLLLILLFGLLLLLLLRPHSHLLLLSFPHSFSLPIHPILLSRCIQIICTLIFSVWISTFLLSFCFKPVLFLVSSSCVFLFYFTSTLSFLLCFILLPYSLFLSVSIPSTYIQYLQPPPHTYIHLQFSSWFRLILPFLFLSSSFFYSVCKFGLSVCLFVCLFVCNKRQNGWTDRAQICCGTSRDHREGLWMI